MNRVLAVDVCGTLFRCNTSVGLVLHHHRRVGNVRRRFFLEVITGRSRILDLAFAAIARISGFDLHRAVTILSLQGESRDALEISALSFIEGLEEKKIHEVHERIQQMRSDGWSPILVSNSIDVIVKPIAEKLSVPFLSSQVGWNDRSCNGRLEVDFTGNKRIKLEEFLGRKLCADQFAVITDNKSDSDLIDLSNLATIVAVGKVRGWMERKNAEILHIK